MNPLKKMIPFLILAVGPVYLVLLITKTIGIDYGIIPTSAWLAAVVGWLAYRSGRNLLLSLAALLAFLALAEGIMALFQGLSINREVYHTTTPYVRPDPSLGWSAIPGAQARVTKTNAKGATIFKEVEYAFDAKGRRTTSGRSPTGQEHVLIFGGSFAFGHGMDWSKSLGARLEERSKGRYVSYSFALDAYGPGQMREQTANETNFNDITQQKGLAVYWFIPHHLARNVLLYDLPTMTQTWSRSIYYESGESGSLKGPFRIETNPRAHRIARLFHRAVRFSPLLGYLWSVLDPHPFVSTSEAAEITAGLIIDSARNYRQRFQGPFLVVMTPQILWQGRGFKIPPKIIDTFKATLTAQGIQVLTIPTQKEQDVLFNLNDRDGHPCDNYYDIVAEYVLEQIN